MKFRKFIVGSGLALALVAGTTACGSSTSTHLTGQQKENQLQSQDTTNLESSQPLPLVYYSQERANLIDIELAEVNDVRTTTFIKALGNVDPIFTCPSIGFGIPETASLSNPWQVQTGTMPYKEGYAVVVGQQEPTGIYAPPSGAGTWLICLADSGQPYINRFEDNTDTIGGPALWNFTKHMIVMNGAPTALATTVGGKKAAVDVRK